MRVTVVDPPAYTPPYDHALCAALARRGLDVELVTSRFRFGTVPPPEGYRRRDAFYRVAVDVPAAKAAQHPLDMTRLARRLRRAAGGVVHFQWLPVPALDRALVRLFPRPLVLTAHDVLPREVRRGGRAGAAALLRAMDAVVAHSDSARARLIEEAGRDRSAKVLVPWPSSLSATSLARLRDDPDQFARDLARPLPRQPSSAARFGTRFHAWVESRFGQQQLVGLDEVPGRGDEGIEDERELKELVDQFSAGPFGERVPYAVEPPFALVLGGQVVRGRIDAVYETEDGFLVVDWKTNQRQSADPLQLAIYRLAWAELMGVPVERVEAAFYYVRSGVLDQPPGLPDREQLEAMVPG